MKNLKTISFSIPIDADREKIWNILWDPINYQKWTNVFSEGSYYKGELKQGNTIHFLGKDGCSMIAIIEKFVANDQIVFAHQKEQKNGVQTETDWQGAKEIYYLKKETDTRTELQVILDVVPDMEPYFNNAFPTALSIVKQLSEQ